VVLTISLHAADTVTEEGRAHAQAVRCSLAEPSIQEHWLSVQPQDRLRPLPSGPTRSRRYQSLGYRAKSVLLGPALKTSQLVHERISKRVALAVFSSDPISSTAYATEEILLVLWFAGTAATGLALPLSIAITGLLGILVLS